MDWDVNAGLLGAPRKGFQQAGTLARAFLVNDFVKSFNPLQYFLVVWFKGCGGFGIHFYSMTRTTGNFH